jgi:hypothetical protein
MKSAKNKQTFQRNISPFSRMKKTVAGNEHRASNEFFFGTE